MINVTRRDPDVVSRSVSENKVAWLGRVIGFDYGVHAGREYRVDVDPSDPENFSRRPDELWVVRITHETIDGSALERHARHRGQVVPNGTYASLAAKEAEREAARTRQAPARLLDAVSTHPLMARRADGVLPIADARPADLLDAALWAAPDEASADLLVSLRSKRPTAIPIPGREARRGVEDILAVLRSKGVELALTPTGTMYAKGERMLNSVRDLIERTAPLLHAHLLGQPMRCELAHKGQAPEAVTLLVGGAAACEQHLTGELEP